MFSEEDFAQVSPNTGLISLFDYLGQPAGGALGKEVAAYATKVGALMSTRTVQTETYNGPVMLYEREFLDHYFSVERKNQVSE